MGIAVGADDVRAGIPGALLRGLAHAPVVAVGPEVPRALEAAAAGVGGLVVLVVRPPLHVEVAEQLHVGARPARALVVAILDLQEGVAHHDLGGRAVVEVIEVPAQGDRAVLGEIGVDLGDGLGEEDRRDLQVRVRHLGRVLRRGVRDGVGHGLEGHRLLGVEVPVGDDVGRPVDADVLALVPEPVRGILDEDVALLTGRRVVVPADVEVRLDRPRGHGRALEFAVRVAIRVGSLDPLVGAHGDEQVLLDPPPDPVELPLIADERELRLVRRVDHSALEVPLTLELRLGDRVLLDLDDRLARLRACGQERRGDQHRHEPDKRTGRHRTS